MDFRENTIKILDENGRAIDIKEYSGLKVQFNGGGSTVLIKKPMRVKKCLIVCGDDVRVEIGEGCDIVGYLFIFATARGSQIFIGNKCSFSGVTIRLQAEPNLQVSIGNRCLFSSDITIRSSDSHTVYDLSTGEALNIPVGVEIGNHVWIGTGVDIMKNSKIPDDCVIAARALVVGQFTNSNSVYAGLPAKLVKTNINWSWSNTYNYKCNR